MLAFSTCWNAQRHTDGQAMLEEVRSLGFRYAELGHGIRLSLLDGIQQAVAAGVIGISSLHNFCPLPLGVMGPAPDYYLPSATRQLEHSLAVRHTLRTLNCAASLGARAVVLHLGRVRMREYSGRLLDRLGADGAAAPRVRRLRDRALRVRGRRSQKYLDRVYGFLEAVVPHAKELGVRLGIETRMGIEDIPNEAEIGEILGRFGSETMGYWHDVGHALTREAMGLAEHDRTLERFRGQTVGMHLQDFIPPAGDHLPPGLGGFDFGRLAPFVTGEMVLAWEIHPRWKTEQILPGLERAHQLLGQPVTA